MRYNFIENTSAPVSQRRTGIKDVGSEETAPRKNEQGKSSIQILKREDHVTSFLFIIIIHYIKSGVCALTEKYGVVILSWSLNMFEKV